MKIVILDSDTVTKGDLPLDEITSLGECRVLSYTEDHRVADMIGDADAVICNKCPITKEVFDSCKDLRFVGLFATGYNNVDLDAARERGAAVCNVPAYSTYAVAQHTFALILEHFNRTAEYSYGVEEGGWIKSKLFSCFGLPMQELWGKTMGIVGYGDIGRRTAAIARAFGMRVVTCTRSPQKVEDGTPCVTLEELLSQSDIVSLHCPLTKDNEKMINRRTLALMKPTAMLVNTARGGLVDEQALADALNSGRIAAAGIDVLAEEPMKSSCPLYKAKNCIITPHIAWAPYETRKRLLSAVAENLRAWIKGEPINDVTKL